MGQAQHCASSMAHESSCAAQAARAKNCDRMKPLFNEARVCLLRKLLRRGRGAFYNPGERRGRPCEHAKVILAACQWQI